jgi:hypothetical protein
MAFGWIGSTIAFGAVVRHRRGVGRYRRTFAHVVFRQISRLAGVARFLPAQLRTVRVYVALNEPKVFEALNHRTDVRDYWRAAFFQLRYEGGGDALIPRCFGNAQID